MKNKKFRSIAIATLLLFTFLAHPFQALAIDFPPSYKPSTDGSEIIYYGEIEDPHLKKLVAELKHEIKILFRMLFSFDWLKHPRLFYHTLKRVFVLWADTMSELATTLSRYIAQIKKEIKN
jgi:hypothetical protein